MKNKFLALLIIFAFVAVAVPQVETRAQDNNRGQGRIPEQYIVVFHDAVSDSDTVAEEMRAAHGLEVSHIYSHAIKGFAARIPEARLRSLSDDPRVDFISEDHYVSIEAPSKGTEDVSLAAQTIPTGVMRVGANLNPNKGTGIGVAVIDTGIQLNHPDLSANVAKQGKSCVHGAKNANDDNGHGTHVAGTIAAVSNTSGVVGVAPGAKLYGVKVLNRNGSGSWSGVICGVDWVTANALAHNIKVANMSLSGGGVSDNNCGNSNNDALHKAICRSRDAGVTYVVAAGNSAAPASNSVPAAYSDAVITVSALADSDGLPGGAGSATSYGLDDTFASFSNYGAGVTLGAPGVNIYSTWIGSGYKSISGTSMASPHVAGAAALYIKSNPGASWATVRDALVGAGEASGEGHFDVSGLHPEKVLRASSL